MLKTAKPQSEGQSFHRRLLSEYNTKITLENYVDYFYLKRIVKQIKDVLEKINESVEKQIKNSKPPKMPPRQQSMVSPITFLPEDFPSPLNPNTEEKGGKHSSAFLSEDSSSFAQIAELASKDNELSKLISECDRLTELFFVSLAKSYKHVEAFLLKAEKELVADIEELHKLSDTEIRSQPESYIPNIYEKIESISKYRSLNLLALRKLMRKFLERCACDSLERQRRVRSIDEIISKGGVANPSVDLRGTMMELIGIFGTVFKYSYEEAVLKLKAYCRCTGLNVQRIIPSRDTFFFLDSYPHNERQGNFAIRVIPGSLSVLSAKMITEVLQCPRFKPCCSQFANGEVNVSLAEPVRGDDVFIVQSISATENISNSTAIMELALMIHCAQLSSASRITAVIPHLAYTKNVASISALAEILEVMGCQHVITVDMHSDQVEGMFSIPLDSISAKYEFVRFLYNELKEEQHNFQNVTIVAPKGNFLGRAKDFADALMRYGKLDAATQFVSVCTATKRIKPKNLPVPSSQPMAIANATRARVESPESDSEFSQGGHLTPTSYVSSTFPTQSGGISVADTHARELEDTMEKYHSSGGDNNGHNTQSQSRSNSTMGIEKALRIQEKGRKGIVTHEVDDDHPFDNIALVGDVKNKVCVILETVIDEAVNITQVAKSLKHNGAERIILVATHCVLSGKARDRLVEGPIDLIITSDSVCQDDVMRDGEFARKLRVIPIAPLIARAIDKIHTENTLSSLYEKE